MKKRTPGLLRGPVVATDATGSFVVVWEGSRTNGDHGIFGRRYDRTGVKRGPAFRVDTQTTRDQSDPAVSADAAGTFVVVWTSYLQDGDVPDSDIRGQRFDNTGTKLGDEFQANTYTRHRQRFPSVSADAAGNFVVVWGSSTGRERRRVSSSILGKCYGCPTGQLAAALPDPSAVGPERRVAKRLARCARDAQRHLEKGVAATDPKQRREYQKVCGRLGKVLDVATSADHRDILSVPLAPIEQAVGALRLAIDC